MSVVAARVYDNRIEIAADSITTRGYIKIISISDKLFRVGNFIVGSTGESEEALMFKGFLENNEIESFDELGLMGSSRIFGNGKGFL